MNAKAIQDEIEAMFVFQQETIARMSLRGCRFEPIESTRRVHQVADGVFTRGALMSHTVYSCVLPDGHALAGVFEDIYAAALAAHQHFMVEDGLVSKEVIQYRQRRAADGAFALDKENEQ